MAKYEARLQGNFDRILEEIDEAVMGGSVSASREDGSEFTLGEARCAVRVYERYSAFGGNRVSMNVTLFGAQENIIVSAITSGGSQAIFLKVNTLGEETFLDTLSDTLDRYAV